MKDQGDRPVIVTNHATDRVKDRCGLSKKIANKVAEKALAYGIQHKDTTGSLKKFLDGLYLSHHNANNMRIYGQKVYLFKNQVLITIINLPPNFAKIVNKINKRNED